MDKLILTVNEYPWTSFFTFMALYVIMNIVAEIVKVIFNHKNKQ